MCWLKSPLSFMGANYGSNKQKITTCRKMKTSANCHKETGLQQDQERPKIAARMQN